MDLRKLEAILKRERPMNLIKIHSFLVLIWYYQRFIEGFSTIASPIGVIIFGSVRFLSKKVTKPKFFFVLKKKPKPSQTGWFRFGSVFLGQKLVQTGLARFFRFWLGFSGFGSVFSGFGSVFFGLARFFRFGSVFPVWLGFGSVFFRFFVGFGSVRFGFFGFLFIKPKPNRTGRFFQKMNRFNRFFFGSVFSVNFFPVFSV